MSPVKDLLGAEMGDYGVRLATSHPTEAGRYAAQTAVLTSQRRARETIWQYMNICYLHILTYVQIGIVAGTAIRASRGCPGRLSERGMGRSIPTAAEDE